MKSVDTDTNVKHSYFTISIQLFFSYTHGITFIISLNEVFGDIMVLASRLHSPVDSDDVNTPNSKSIQWISFKFYMRVDTPLRYVAIDTLRVLEQLRSHFAAKRHFYPPNLQNAISP